MLSALDSNVLIDIRQGNPVFGPTSIAALKDARMRGPVLICDIVYAEVCTLFPGQQLCDDFLASLNVLTESLNKASSFLASRSWSSYLRSGGKRIRILPDFLIAAHATNQADALITRDRGFYREHFPKLKVIDPTKP